MKFCRGGGLVSERKEDKGREMRALVTPARIISIAVFVLFSLLSYFAGRTWDQATIDLSKVQADVSELKQRKLDTAKYDHDCEVVRQSMENKASTEDLKRIDQRLTMILDVMIDPAKKDAIRAARIRENNKVWKQ
jgi:hypothetical protein